MSRSGSRWSDEEIERLVSELNRKLTIEEIAKSHERTPNAIYLYACRYLSLKQEAGEDISGYLNLWPITQEEVTNYNLRPQMAGKEIALLRALVENQEQRIARLEERFAELGYADPLIKQ